MVKPILSRYLWISLSSLEAAEAEAGEGRDEPRAVPSVPTWPWAPPLRGLTYGPWPGPGDSEGGVWDR